MASLGVAICAVLTLGCAFVVARTPVPLGVVSDSLRAVLSMCIGAAALLLGAGLILL